MTNIQIAATALAMLFASATLGQAENSGSDTYAKCKSGYELNSAKTRCVKK